MPTIHKTIQKVREFVLLPAGWHFGDGVPTPHERVEQAIRFLLFASQRGLDRANAFPGVTGQVEVTFYDADRMLEVTIESDGAITIAEDRGSEQIYFEENRTKNDVYRRLEEFSQSIWPSSDLFIVSTTTQNVRVPVSQAWLSTSEPENRFPLLIVTAPEPKAVPSVLIFQGTTMSSLETPLYTGQYEMPISQMSVESSRSELPVGMNAIGTSTIGGGVLLAGLSKV